MLHDIKEVITRNKKKIVKNQERYLIKKYKKRGTESIPFEGKKKKGFNERLEKASAQQNCKLVYVQYDAN